jgi:hypothetical protein
VKQAVTDQQGKFVLSEHGAIPVRATSTGKSGSTLDVGILKIVPGYRLLGRLVLSDGKAVPPGTRPMLSRAHAWDQQIVKVAADGSFAFGGLPTEQYHLDTNVTGYRPSSKNYSLHASRQSSLFGLVQGDIKGLTFLLELGKVMPVRARPQGVANFEQFQRAVAESQRRGREPLRGAE